MTPEELNKFADEQLEIKEIKAMITKAIMQQLKVIRVEDIGVIVASNGVLKMLNTDSEYTINKWEKLTQEAVKQLKKENE